MVKEVINIGSTPGDGSGDTARDGFEKVNDNFTELYDSAPSIGSEYKSVLTPANYNSDTFTDVTGATGSITVTGASCYVWAIVSYEAEETGVGLGGVNAEIRLLIDTTVGDSVSIDFTTNALQAGSTHLRSDTVLTPDTYDVKVQARRVSGNRDFTVNKAKLFAIVLQTDLF